MSKRGRKLPPDAVVQEAVAMYLAGKTLKAIGAAFGKTRTWAWHIIRKRVPRGRQRLARVTEEQLAAAVAEYSAGANLEKAAGTAGCSVFSAWKRLDQLGMIRAPQCRNGVPDATAAAIRTAIASGLTPWEAAKQLGVHLVQVLTLLEDGNRAPRV